MLTFRVRRSVAAMLAVPILAGCSVQRHGLQVPEHAPSSRTTTAASETGTPASPSGPATALPSAAVVDDPSAAPGEFTGDQLRPALLGVADLAPGWTVSTSATNVNGIPATGCPPLDKLNHWPATRAVIGFSTGDRSAELAEGLTSVPEQNAKDLLRTARTIIDECLTITVRDNLGNPHFLQVSEPSFARMADDTYAVRLSAEGLFYYDTVLIRRGGLVLTAAAIATTPQSGMLDPFVRQALAKAVRTLR
jgi:hypothetical protein